jgi:hypothetical protein
MTAMPLSPLPVADIGANTNELIAQAAEFLRSSKQRRAVFTVIYTGKQRIKTVDELMVSTGLVRTRVLDAGKFLAAHHIVKQTKIHSRTAYEKIDFYQRNRSKILRLAANSTALERFPTKRRPQGTEKIIKITNLNLERDLIKARLITIDEIASFAKVKDIPYLPKQYYRMAERDFKNGVAKILGEYGEFKDWGGEHSDLFSTHIVISEGRKSVAFAFKGPGQKGKLTPGKLGKNGDQIQRLMTCPADVFFVQYWGEIDQSVLEQLEKFAQLKSLFERKTIWYGLIDGNDSARLIQAYPEAFEETVQNLQDEQPDVNIFG